MPVTSMALRATTALDESSIWELSQSLQEFVVAAALQEFVLQGVEPVQPLIETIAGNGGKGNVFNFRMNFAGVFEGQVGIELDVGEKIGLREKHQRKLDEKCRDISEACLRLR